MGTRRNFYVMRPTKSSFNGSVWNIVEHTSKSLRSAVQVARAKEAISNCGHFVTDGSRRVFATFGTVLMTRDTIGGIHGGRSKQHSENQGAARADG